MMQSKNSPAWLKSILLGESIIVFFIMAFEVMLMSNPFAFFFYSVFNPFFHWIDSYTATRWLTHFFLPHMILPPTLALKIIWITGLILFLVGSITFIACTFQVYLGKIFKWGIAEKGLYRLIRHPQYLALGIWGVGMAILWPKFIVLATLSLMFMIYYFLAKDEECRMTRQYGSSYLDYMNATGMFLPKIKAIAGTSHFAMRSKFLKYATISIVIVSLVIGAGFISRYVTLNSLHFYSKENITLVSIMPEDGKLSRNALESISLNEDAGDITFLKKGKNYLGYLMPVDYIMQGIIANIGNEHHLYKQHHTFALITDWVLHPFKHLHRPPAMRMAKMSHVDPAKSRCQHCPLGIDNPNLNCKQCPYRRIILVEIDHDMNKHFTGKNLFDFNTTRLPIGFIDIDTQSGEIVAQKKVGARLSGVLSRHRRFRALSTSLMTLAQRRPSLFPLWLF